MAAHHVTPVRTYVYVFLALLVGTGLTVAASLVDLGWANNLAAMGIAITKALLVLYFFMELRQSTRMTVLTAAAGFFWLVLMITTFMMDYWFRGAVVLPVPGK
jgi:cytochrome c oxidase subunit 4